MPNILHYCNAPLQVSIDDQGVYRQRIFAPEIRLVDGLIHYCDELSYRQVVGWQQHRGIAIPVDYNHGSEIVTADPAPAAGWVKSLEWVEGEGLYATIEFLPRAAEMIAAREYRYFSPCYQTIQRTDGRHYVALLRSIALTNTPRTIGNPPWIASLNNKKVLSMDFLLQLAARLGIALPPDADMEVVQAALVAYQPESMTAIEAALQVKGEIAALAKINALQAATTHFASMLAKIEVLEQRQKEQQAEQLILAAAGKLTPAMIEQGPWRDLAKTDPDQFGRIVASLPQQIPAPLELPKEAPGGGYEPDKTTLHLANIMGVSRESLVKANQPLEETN